MGGTIPHLVSPRLSSHTHTLTHNLTLTQTHRGITGPRQPQPPGKISWASVLSFSIQMWKCALYANIATKFLPKLIFKFKRWCPLNLNCRLHRVMGSHVVLFKLTSSFHGSVIRILALYCVITYSMCTLIKKICKICAVWRCVGCFCLCCCFCCILRLLFWSTPAWCWNRHCSTHSNLLQCNRVTPAE